MTESSQIDAPVNRPEIQDLAQGERRTTPHAKDETLVGYLQQARDELFNTRSNVQVGFRDADGYIVDYEEEQGVWVPHTRGEGTLHTAIAAVSIATGNYTQDSWENAAANNVLTELLETLLNRSWGDTAGLFRVHPIRHPDKYEYNANGRRMRQRPLTKDSFGTIPPAAFHAYHCSNCNFRQKAERVVA
jgi:hypothetical protein